MLSPILNLPNVFNTVRAGEAKGFSLAERTGTILCVSLKL